MKVIALLALFASAQCAMIPAGNTASESGFNLEKRASCNVCVVHRQQYGAAKFHMTKVASPREVSTLAVTLISIANEQQIVRSGVFGRLEPVGRLRSTKHVNGTG
ncbi:hypothetical protein AUP68_08721 [Ilyonectria robusta]